MTENKYHRIENFKDFIDLGIAFCANWFRGHSEIIDDLIPKAYRNNNWSWENRFVNEFQKYGRTVEERFPSSKLELLCLMQHFGTPTRLLDWTENILVALFFAVTENQDKDGEIWILNPQHIDLELKKRKIGYNDLFTKLIEEPFNQIKNDPNQPKDLIPLYLNPPYTNKRMNPQQSTFTLHPNHVFNGIKLTELLNNKIALDKVIIPADKKAMFEDYLYFLGFSNRTLFPDLEGLSKDISKNKIKRTENRQTGISVSGFLNEYGNK